MKDYNIIFNGFLRKMAGFDVRRRFEAVRVQRPKYGSYYLKALKKPTKFFDIDHTQTMGRLLFHVTIEGGTAYLNVANLFELLNLTKPS